MTSDTVDTLLAVSKFTSIILSGLFGILALAARYQDNEGRLTKWGRIALIGAIITFVVAMGVQSLELEKARHEAREAAESTQQELKRFSQMLAEISRAQHLIGEIRAGFSIVLPRSHPSLATFIRDIDSTADILTADYRQHGPHSPLQQEKKVMVFDAFGNEPGLMISFQRTSPLLPASGTDADRVFNHRALKFQLYKTKLQHNELVAARATIQADLEFLVMADTYAHSSPLGLKYDVQSKQIIHEGTDLAVYSRRESGKIVSTLDLPGSILVVVPVNFIPHVEHELDLRRVLIRISEGYHFEVSGEGFTRYYEGDMPLFVHQFAPSKGLSP